MKWIAPAMFCIMMATLTGSWIYADVIKGIVIPAPMTTGNTDNKHSIGHANEMQGTMKFLGYTSELRTIPESRRERGMLAYVRENDSYYKLYSSPGHFWRVYAPTVDIRGKLDVERFLKYSAMGRFDAARHERLSSSMAAQLPAKLDVDIFKKYTSGRAAAVKGDKGDPGTTWPPPFDGLDGPDTLRCNIVGGTRGITYDKDGRNPMPSVLESFIVYLYAGAQELVATVWEWYQPATATHLTAPPAETDGMQHRRQYYQPGPFSTWSAGRSNNYVSVMVGYSSHEPPYGKRWCNTSVPIAVTKIGDRGLQGPQGESATVTESASITAFATTPSGSALSLQNNTSSSRAKLLVRDQPGNVRIQANVGKRTAELAMKNISGSATLIKQTTDGQNASATLLNRGGYDTIKISNDGTIEVRNNLGILWLKLNGGTRELTTYSSDGTTELFKVYSDGKWKGVEGYPGTNGYCSKANTDGTRTWGSCGTGSGSVGGNNHELQFNDAGSAGGAKHARYSSNIANTSAVTTFTGTVIFK